MAEEGVTVTVRLIRSFPHRNIKHIVFKNVSVSQTAADFMTVVNKDIATCSELPPPFKKYQYDTMKILHKAHGFKTNDPVINTDHEENILDPGRTLSEQGVANETEISYFKREDYEHYKANPVTQWL
ncbi:UPF0538 protein C2orf76 homolog isoform X2 [Lingula anatina]|nr:UPF0538 protein C2orf76 homolog isoform X2 [Lingula anatina]XP_013394644.1 UPF0538 protein C2orf76 homolog isoform X2 [Lingula anatina]|eukprot:XP_013394643.1 UPF0538 protein C2orf76 homolog isoform X2 [Lingula anatina]